MSKSGPSKPLFGLIRLSILAFTLLLLLTMWSVRAFHDTWLGELSPQKPKVKFSSSVTSNDCKDSILLTGPVFMSFNWIHFVSPSQPNAHSLCTTPLRNEPVRVQEANKKLSGREQLKQGLASKLISFISKQFWNEKIRFILFQTTTKRVKLVS